VTAEPGRGAAELSRPWPTRPADEPVGRSPRRPTRLPTSLSREGRAATRLPTSLSRRPRPDALPTSPSRRSPRRPTRPADEPVAEEPAPRRACRRACRGGAAPPDAPTRACREEPVAEPPAPSTRGRAGGRGCRCSSRGAEAQKKRAAGAPPGAHEAEEREPAATRKPIVRLREARARGAGGGRSVRAPSSPTRWRRPSSSASTW
jgi:hypothetical protein